MLANLQFSSEIYSNRYTEFLHIWNIFLQFEKPLLAKYRKMTRLRIVWCTSLYRQAFHDSMKDIVKFTMVNTDFQFVI